MQADVINSVMKRIEGNLAKVDVRMVESIKEVNNDLNKRFQLQ